MRTELSTTVSEELKPFLELPRALPQSVFSKAKGYVLGHWAALDGSSSIHRMPVNSNGIAAATFNESIARMSREVTDLLDEVQDES